MEKKFGSKIRDLRQEKGIGLREFAEKIIISAAYLSRIERGLEAPPSGNVIKKMAEILKINPDELFKLATEEARDKKRMPPDIYEAYSKDGVYMKRVPEFLRLAKEKKLTDKAWQKIIKKLQDGE